MGIRITPRKLRHIATYKVAHKLTTESAQAMQIAERISVENRCRICNEPGDNQVFRVREMMFGTRDTFEYFQCKRCECLQISEIPDNLSSYYPENYYSHQNITTENKKWILTSALEKLLIDTALFNKKYKLSSIARRFVSLPNYFFRARPTLLQRARINDYRARILDIGCGTQALWLQDLQRVGFANLTGIDPFAKGNFSIGRIKILCMDASELAHNTDHKFDLIALNHSLEHIPDQFGTLASINRLLSPTGTCVIRIPTISSISWKVYGVDWVELDAPRHLYIHSKKSIRELARRAGLELFDTQYDTTAFEFYGSEQYRLNIPLTSPESLWANRESTVFTREKQIEFAERAEKANADGTAGRACFFFRHARPSDPSTDIELF